MESQVETETEMQRALHCDAMRRTSNDPDDDDPDDDAPTTTTTTSTTVDALVDRIEALKVKPGETKTEEERASSAAASSVIEGDASNGVPMVRRKRSVVVARRMIANALDIDLDGARGSSKTEEEKRATREARKKKAEERAREREKRERERDEGRAGPVS